MTHLVDDGPGVFLGDGSWEALEDLVQCETLCVPVQLTSSPGGRGRGRGRAWVSLHSAHDDSLPRHYSGLMSVKLSQHKSIHSFVIVVSGIPDQQLSLNCLDNAQVFFRSLWAGSSVTMSFKDHYWFDIEASETSLSARHFNGSWCSDIHHYRGTKTEINTQSYLSIVLGQLK